MTTHPLVRLFERIGSGIFPSADGLVDVFPSPPGPVDALIALTGHHIVAADVSPTWVRTRLKPGDFMAPMSARFISELAVAAGTDPGNLDIVLCAPALEQNAPEPQVELLEIEAAQTRHPRVLRAQLFRDGVRVFETRDGSGLLTIGRGLGDRWETSFEVSAGKRHKGLGRALALSSRRLVPSGSVIFAQVTPGNAASLRATWSAGFRPVGSEVLFLKNPQAKQHRF